MIQVSVKWDDTQLQKKLGQFAHNLRSTTLPQAAEELRRLAVKKVTGYAPSPSREEEVLVKGFAPTIGKFVGTSEEARFFRAPGQLPLVEALEKATHLPKQTGDTWLIDVGVVSDLDKMTRYSYITRSGTRIWYNVAPPPSEPGIWWEWEEGQDERVILPRGRWRLRPQPGIAVPWVVKSIPAHFMFRKMVQDVSANISKILRRAVKEASKNLP